MKLCRACLVALAAWSGPADAATLRLELSGTAYHGGPAFDAAFGPVVVARGTVDPPPAGAGGAVFEISVSDLLLAGNPDLRIRLTNDAWDGPGADRNLYVVAVALDGEPVPLDGFRIISHGESKQHRLRNGRLEIWSSQEVAIARAPTEGWPLGAPALRSALDAAASQVGWPLD